MRNIHFVLTVTVLQFVTATPPAMAADCPTPKTLPTCSYVATNGRCKISIDRMNPVTPAVIYVKRGCSVTVEVTHSTGLEDLTLDWKSSATVVPPDTFQSVFSSLTPTLKQFTVVTIATKDASVNFIGSLCEASPNDQCFENPEAIRLGQQKVLDQIDGIDPLMEAKAVLQCINWALQPPPRWATPTKAQPEDKLRCTNRALQAPDGWPKAYISPWYQTDAWKEASDKQLGTVISEYRGETLKNIPIEIFNLAVEIRAFERPAKPERASQSSILDQNQATLQNAYDSLVKNNSGNIAKLMVLRDAVAKIPPQGPGITGNSEITDQDDKKNYYQAQTWNVNYANKLSPAAKKVAADTVKSDNADLLGGLADPPAKQPVVTIAVQFQSPSRFEVSSGLMVPVTPYHSYLVAPVASKGMITDNVVQENKTYTVVPMAFVNYRVAESTIGQQNSAFFVTGGVGYNPVTSTVEFGTGLTFSYRSITISGLVDIGRDTKLIGGFKVGESLGLNPPRNVPTATGWVVKPAFALSVRIPLGGSGK